MKSVCSNCGGELVHGNALGACSRCGHALTGALWTLEPPSQRRVVGRGGEGNGRSRLVLHIAAGMLAGAVASFILFGLIEAERAAQRGRPGVAAAQHALRPAAATTGLSPGKRAPATPALGGAALLHVGAPARPLGALAHADGGGSP